MQCAEKAHSYKKIYTTSLSGENRDIDQRSQQSDGVDVAAAVGSFAAGGEEVGVIVGTDATDLDVGLCHSAFQKRDAADFEKVDMMAALETALSTRTSERPDFIHRETGRLEKLSHILAYLEIVDTDTRADDGTHIRRLCTIILYHCQNRLCSYLIDSSTPAAMGSPDTP